MSVEDSVVKFTHRKGLFHDFKADVLVDEDKPFIICYDHKRMKVMPCHYGWWNEFGCGFHG